MGLTCPCGQNSDLRHALYVDFPPRLDFIICSNRQLFCSRNDPEEADVLAEGAAGQRSSWRWTGPFCLSGSLMCSLPHEFKTPGSHYFQGCFWLPLSTSGNPHDRIETYMKYHLIIILDSMFFFPHLTHWSNARPSTSPVCVITRQMPCPLTQLPYVSSWAVEGTIPS